VGAPPARAKPSVGERAGRRDGANVACCGTSPEWLRRATQAVTDDAPEGRYHVLDGQNHMVEPQALAPVPAEFFGA